MAQGLLIQHHLKRLKLPAMARHYPKLAQEAAQHNWAYEAYLLSLLELEVAQREENQQKRRIAQARFPYLRTLDQFDFSAMPSVNKARVLELAKGEYLARKENLVLVGNMGTGKKPTQQPALIDTTVFNLETIKVVDPTHPLFGRRLPLVSVTTIQGLRHACLVRLEGGVERTIPIEATDLGASPLPLWPSPLSLKALCALLAVYLEVTIVEGEGHVARPEGSAARLGVGPPGSAPASSGAGGDGPNHEGGVRP